MKMKRWTAALLCSALLFFCYGGNATVYGADGPPGISSLSAVVYEPESGTLLYEKDSRTKRPMASTTKLMTALLAAENLEPTAVVEVDKAALPVEGTQIGLAPGDSVTVESLLAGLLLSSGNDAANALALAMTDSLPAFSDLMNTRGAALGMTDSHFVTPSGLDSEGHGASARDMALLGAAVLEKPLLAQLCASKTAPLSINDRQITVANHNKLLRLYEPCIGMKTGFTKKSGRCLVSAARRDGITLVIATLNGGDYWNDHMALYEYAFPLVEQRTLPLPAAESCPVAGGTAGSVVLEALPPMTAVLRREEQVTMTVELPAFMWAPVEAGQVIGQVRYTAGERVLATCPLTAAQAVPARNRPSGFRLLCRRWRQLLEALVT